MNSATLIMYRFTVDQYDAMDAELCAISLKQFWLDMMKDFSDQYDEEWYALIATPSIRKTINWSFIAAKYMEKRMIQDYME